MNDQLSGRSFTLGKTEWEILEEINEEFSCGNNYSQCVRVAIKNFKKFNDRINELLIEKYEMKAEINSKQNKISEQARYLARERDTISEMAQTIEQQKELIQQYKQRLKNNE
jgi:predicted  nucleic acid-binding Zn-ribbon protein